MTDPVVATGVRRTVDAAIPRSINAGILMNYSARSLDLDFIFVIVGAMIPCRSYSIDGAIGTIMSLNSIEKSSICPWRGCSYIHPRSFDSINEVEKILIF